MHRRVSALTAVVLGAAVLLTACATTAPGTPAAGPGRVIGVAASINVWGSILAQLGGTRVSTTSIITNPATDPHAYEPTPADARTIASAAVFVENGIGYDPWAARALAANPVSHRIVLDVGQLLGIPANGNPHRWYSPADVATVADAISADLKRADPADSEYFDAQLRSFETAGLARYHQLITDIQASYAGTPVGASESIFTPMAAALGLALLTPATFLRAISEGTDPSAADKATVDAQIAGRKIKVYVFNSQNATPDVAAQVAAARSRGIPVVAVTETLSPANASFQDWQSNQLQALAVALAQGTGR